MIGERESGEILIAKGEKGVGKTHRTLEECIDYMLGDPSINRKPEKVLYFDSNNELGNIRADFKLPIDSEILYYDASVEDEHQRTQNLGEYAKFMGVSFWRIIPFLPNGQAMTIAQKKQCCLDICNHYHHGLAVLEDVNNYMVNTKDTSFISALIGTRHKPFDLMLHFQSLGKITTDLFQNANHLRIHMEANPFRYTHRANNPELSEIAEYIVMEQYAQGNPRYCLYIKDFGRTIVGVTEQQFRNGCEKYLTRHSKILNDMMKMQHLSGQKVYETRAHAFEAWLKEKRQWFK